MIRVTPSHPAGPMIITRDSTLMMSRVIRLGDDHPSPSHSSHESWRPSDDPMMIRVGHGTGIPSLTVQRFNRDGWTQSGTGAASVTAAAPAGPGRRFRWTRYDRRTRGGLGASLSQPLSSRPGAKSSCQWHDPRPTVSDGPPSRRELQVEL
jgi:hypothetical protein